MASLAAVDDGEFLAFDRNLGIVHVWRQRILEIGTFLSHQIAGYVLSLLIGKPKTRHNIRSRSYHRSAVVRAPVVIEIKDVRQTFLGVIFRSNAFLLKPTVRARPQARFENKADDPIA